MRPEVEQPRQGQADDGSDCGDLGLGPRVLGLLLHPGHTPEDEEGDGADPDAVMEGHEGVAQLVEQDRHEEQQRGREPLGPIGRSRKVRVVLGKVPGGQRPRDQAKDDHPTEV